MEWFTDTSDLICSGICLVIITTGLVCAAFRWYHMCAPYNHNPAFYYPARPMVTLLLLCQLLYIPFLIRPSDPHTLVYAKALLLILVTTFVPLILNRFFKARKFDVRNIWSALYILPLISIAVIGITTIFCPENIFVSNTTVFKLIFGASGLILTVLMAKIMIWLAHRIDRHNMDLYSNESDFPIKFANKLRIAPWIMTTLCWMVFLYPGRVLLCISWGIFSVFAVIYTIMIMNPQRRQTTGNMNIPSPEKDSPLNEDVRLKVIALVHQHYLNPHITRRDIISLFDYGQRTEAGHVISHYGFYEMVNTVRLEHARLYASSHPNETKESVAEQSGFKDRFAMRHAARKISIINSDLLTGFQPLNNGDTNNNTR